VQCYASAGISCNRVSVCVFVCVCVCLCYTLVLYWNGCTYRADIGHVDFPRFILHYVLRKLQYLQKMMVLPSWTLSQTLNLENLAMAHSPSLRWWMCHRSLIDDTWRRQWTWASALNSQLATITCWSHSASSFVYSTMGNWVWCKLLCRSFSISWYLHTHIKFMLIVFAGLNYFVIAAVIYINVVIIRTC